MDSSNCLGARASSPSSAFHQLASTVNLVVEDNVIRFSDDITYESCFRLNTELNALAKSIQAAEKQAKDTMPKLPESKHVTVTVSVKCRPIILVLTTFGGSVHAAFTVVDCIRSLSVPVHTVAMGFVASAGTLIAMSGAKRCITRNSYMLIHELRTSMWGKFSDLRQGYDNSRRLMEHLVRLYVHHTKMTKEEVEDMLKCDVDINPDEALQRGLVDCIIDTMAEAADPCVKPPTPVATSSTVPAATTAAPAAAATSSSSSSS